MCNKPRLLSRSRKEILASNRIEDAHIKEGLARSISYNHPLYLINDNPISARKMFYELFRNWDTYEPIIKVTIYNIGDRNLRVIRDDLNFLYFTCDYYAIATSTPRYRVSWFKEIVRYVLNGTLIFSESSFKITEEDNILSRCRFLIYELNSIYNSLGDIEKKVVDDYIKGHLSSMVSNE